MQNTVAKRMLRRKWLVCIVLATVVVVSDRLAAAFRVVDVSSCSPRHSSLSATLEPKRFGRKSYWDSFYQEEASFSWYAGWADLEPFVREFVQPHHHVLLPGVGNDATLLDMFESGYTNITALDYASEGITRCRDMLGEKRLRSKLCDPGVTLEVADVRDLSKTTFHQHSIDAVLEKGTLDAVYISGGSDKSLGMCYLEQSISEMGRLVKPGGVWISIAGVVDNEIEALFQSHFSNWEQVVSKDELFTTQDGFTSNNIDASLLVWRKRAA